MAKASIRLPNGTTVLIEGTTDEVRRLLEFYGQAPPISGSNRSGPGRDATRKPERRKPPQTDAEKGPQPNLAEVINLIKSCDEAESIESQILDRTSQVNRILLPLFVVQKHLGSAFGLTSGDISRIVTDLGIPMQTPNVSRTLSSTASRYVVGHAVRRKGKAIRYKLSPRGVQYFTSVLKGMADGKQG